MVQDKLCHKNIQDMEAGQFLKMVRMLSLHFVCNTDLIVESAQI